MTLFEADEAASRIREEVDPNANIIFGATFNPALEGKMRVSVVATGIEAAAAEKAPPKIPEAARYYAGKLGFVGTRAPQEPAARFTPAASVRNELPTAPEVARRPEPVAEQRNIAASEPRAEKHSLVSFSGSYTTFIGAVKYAEERTEQPAAVPAIPRTPSFVSPPAAQPAQRSFFSQAPESSTDYARKPTSHHPMRSNGIRYAQEEPERKERENGANPAANFLNRMANVGRVLAAKAEKPQHVPQPERSTYVAEKAKVEVTERNSKTPTDSEYLEIPAFLRRQAN
jgi:cell division protein FtsZ